MAAMLSLLDALPRHERVDIGGGQMLDVFGISAEDIGKILERYPDAFQQIANSGSQPTAMNPGLLGALIAASMRHVNGSISESFLGNEDAEKNARSFGVSDQVKIMHALGRCTFPDGVGPFLESLVSMSASTSEAMDLVVKAASKGPVIISPPTPKPSEPPDTPPSGS